MNILGALFEFVNHAAVPWTLAGIIIFFALIWAAIFTRRINALQRAIQPVVEHLRGIPKEQFVAQYEGLNERITANSTLAHSWKKFSESLLLPDDESEPVRVTQPPEAYFDQANLVASRLNLRFYQSVPNILVGVGLLFTFIGLIAALFFASEGVTAKDIAETQKALGNLLHAATFKFVTSVAGLFSSLVFSWWEKHCLHNVQRMLDELCQSLEERMVFTTPEQLAYAQIQETQQQTLQLERFNTDFAISIANKISEALDNTFAERLQHVLDGLTQEIKDLGERLGKVGEEGMQDLLNGFLEKLKDGTGTEMNSLKTTLTELDASLKKTAEAIEQSGSFFSKQVRVGAQPLESATTSFKESIEKLDGIVKDAQSSGQTMLDLRDELKDTAGSLEQAANPLSEAARNLRDAADKVSAEKINVQEIANDLITGIQQMKAISGMLGDLVKSISELMKKGRDTFGDAGKSLTQGVEEATDNMAKKLDEASQKLVGGIGKFDTSVNQLGVIVGSAGNVGEQMLRAQNNLSQSADQFSDASSNIESLIKYLYEATRNLKEAAEKVSAEKIDSQNVANDLLTSIQQIKAISETLGNLAKTIGDLTEKGTEVLGGAGESIAKGVEDAASNMAKRLDEASQKLVGGIDKFDTSVNQLNSIVGSAGNVGEQMLRAQNNLSQSAEQFKTASSNVDASLGKLTDTLSAVQNLSALLSGQAKAAELGVESLQTLVSDLKSSEETIKSIWTSYKTRFESVDENTGRMFGEINRGLYGTPLPTSSRRAIDVPDGLESFDVSGQFHHPLPEGFGAGVTIALAA